METTEKQDGTARIFGKWFNDIGSPMMDNYHKQLNALFSLYTNFLNPQFEALRNHMMKFNTNRIDLLQKYFQEMQSNWGELNGKSQEIIKKQWEVSNNNIASMLETYNNQMEVSTESAKKLMEEVNN